MNKRLTPLSTAYLPGLHVLVQTIPALTAAAHELLQRFPPKDCKTPVEVSHRLLSPRGGRSLRSPGRASDRSASQAAACSQSHWLYACFMRDFHTYIHAYTMRTVHLLSFVQYGVYLRMFYYTLLNVRGVVSVKHLQNPPHRHCNSLPNFLRLIILQSAESLLSDRDLLQPQRTAFGCEPLLLPRNARLIWCILLCTGAEPRTKASPLARPQLAGLSTGSHQAKTRLHSLLLLGAVRHPLPARMQRPQNWHPHQV